MRLRILLVICALGWQMGAYGQINPMIPLMVQPLRLESPLLRMQQLEALRAATAQAAMAEFQARRAAHEAAIAEAEARRAAEEERNRQSTPAPTPQQPGPIDPVIQDWLKAALPRLHLYPDFDKVVFAPDVPITTDMVRLMAGSTYAADIAYYFGTHKAEAWAVSQMPLLEASRAVSAIEERVKR